MLQYWLSVVQKGVHDSLDFIQQSKSGIVFGVLVLLLTGLLLWKRHGWRDAMTHWWRTAGEGVVIALVAWILVLLMHLVYEPFHLQYDERARTVQARTDRDVATTQLLLCNADLKGSDAKIDLLGKQVTAQQTQISGQQTLIVGQQTTLTAQQTTLNSQQTTVNSCVVALGQANVPKPLQFTSAMDRITLDSKWKHYLEMVVFANQETIPRVRIMCDNNIGDLTARIVGAGGGFLLGGSKKLSGNSWLVNLQSPPITAITPLAVIMSYDEDDIGTCWVTQ